MKWTERTWKKIDKNYREIEKTLVKIHIFFSFKLLLKIFS